MSLTHIGLGISRLQILPVDFFLQSLDSLVKGRQGNIQYQRYYGAGHACHMEDEQDPVIAVKLPESLLNIRLFLRVLFIQHRQHFLMEQLILLHLEQHLVEFLGDCLVGFIPAYLFE